MVEQKKKNGKQRPRANRFCPKEDVCQDEMCNGHDPYGDGLVMFDQPQHVKEHHQVQMRVSDMLEQFDHESDKSAARATETIILGQCAHTDMEKLVRDGGMRNEILLEAIAKLKASGEKSVMVRLKKEL